MIFPGSRLWYEGAASDLSALTDEIKTSSLSGHIVLEFQDSLDLIVISQGEFLKVVECIGRRIMTTKKYREIWGKCQIKKGRMYVFELPPELAARLRGLAGRRQLCSGTSETCNFTQTVLDQKKLKISGILDCVAAEGRGILEFAGGTITSCYFTEYHGLAWKGIEAFRKWHVTLQHSLKPFTLWLSQFQEGADNSESWDVLLLEKMDEVRLPLRASGERLFSAFGKAAFPGEIVFMENLPAQNTVYILDGKVELSRMAGGVKQILGHAGPGTFLNLSSLSGVKSSSLTAIAVSNCRYLSFGRSDLDVVCRNSPSLGADLMASVLAQLHQVKGRLQVYREDPPLMDLEYRALEILNLSPNRISEGLEPGTLLSELSQTSSVSLTEMDKMISKLVQAQRLTLSEGRLHLRPEEL